jgi:hypothetical protein
MSMRFPYTNRERLNTGEVRVRMDWTLLNKYWINYLRTSLKVSGCLARLEECQEHRGQQERRQRSGDMEEGRANDLKKRTPEFFLS